MSRPRKNFFIRFDELSNGGQAKVGDTISVSYPEADKHFIITKLHPRKGGVTARKA